MIEKNPNLCGYFIAESVTEPDNLSHSIVVDNRDDVVIETILQEAEVANRNRRIYSKDALQSALSSPVIKEKLAMKTFFGECDHPQSNSIERQQYIDKARVSHIIEDIWWTGNIVNARVATARTERGRDMAGLIRQGSKVAFSMRGLGGITRKVNGLTRVEKPLYIITYDYVSFPSHANSYETKILKEEFNNDTKNKNSILNEGLLIPMEMNDIFDFITNESKNVKISMDELEIDKNKAKLELENNNKILAVTNSDGTYKLFVEDRISNEVNNFLSKLK